MIASVATARARVEQNERLLLSTRHRLRVSRRLLYCPGLTIRGGSGEADGQSSLRRTVRTLLASGALSPIRGSVHWAGYGSGHACCVCAKPIGSSDVEYEVHDGRPKMPGCHFRCFVVWHEESRSFSEHGASAC
jgi:hypothetical protein